MKEHKARENKEGTEDREDDYVQEVYTLRHKRQFNRKKDRQKEY